jgi:hypothetical protein
LDWTERAESGLGQTVPVKRSDSEKEGVLLRIDWLRDVSTSFGKAVLAVALEFG